MFGPKRKAGENTFRHIDPPITQKKYDDFVKSVEHLKKVVRPRVSKEVMILAEGGDFSENTGYQAVKGRLRGINSKILELETRINKAQIILPVDDTSRVALGHTVTLTIGREKRKFKILGSTESNPGKGIISHNSPIGSAIMGKEVGDSVKVLVNGSFVDCVVETISLES